MSRHKTGDLVHMGNVQIDNRETKYAVIVHPGRKWALFLNTPAIGGKWPTFSDYLEHWCCVLISKRQYGFLNVEKSCISCREYIKYNRHEGGSIINEITHKEDALDLEDLARLYRYILYTMPFRPKERRIILRSIRIRMDELIREEVSLIWQHGFDYYSSNSNPNARRRLAWREQCLLDFFRWPVNQQIINATRCR